MHIVLCGSMTFFDEMNEIASQLRAIGHTVVAPVYAESEQLGDEITLEEKHTLMVEYFDEIQQCDAVLVYNAPKRGVAGYIGANTLIEMAVACAAKKQIYLWEAVGEIAAKEEIEAMLPIVIDKNVGQINYSGVSS